MIKMTLARVLAAGLMIVVGSGLKAQKGVEDGSMYGHGEDSIRCVRSLSLSRDFVKQRDYATALPYWKVVFDECPLCSKNIYLDGVKLYKNLLDNTTSEVRTASLIDTLMLIYDRRMKYFGEKGNVLGRQGVDLLRYGRDKLENIEKAYGYLKESIKLREEKASDAVLASYISSSIILFQNGKFSPGQVIEDYILISEMLSNDPSNQELKETIDMNFIQGGPSKCEDLISYFQPLLESKKQDVSFLKMLTAILRDRDCTDSELFFNASKYLHPLSPSAESALNIAILAFKNKDYTEAMKYYQQALSLETVEDKKADYYFGMAACYDGQGNNEKARELALKASAIRPNWGEPYILIGQLYANSKETCASIRLPNSIYWVAVDMFMKANYFPNKEVAFFENVMEGDTFVVGCWINETTKARFK